MRLNGLFLVSVALFFLANPPIQAQAENEKKMEIDGVLKELNARQQKDAFAIAEFYRRTGHTDSAVFYYQLICRRYPETETTKYATQRIAELVDGGFVQENGSNVKPLPTPEPKPKKVGQIIIIGGAVIENGKFVQEDGSDVKPVPVNHPQPVPKSVDQAANQTRVGQVIVGNEVIQDRVIRRVVGLYPGQILQYPGGIQYEDPQYEDLRIAKEKLLKLLFEGDPVKNIPRPTIMILDDSSVFKDILITAQEAGSGTPQLAQPRRRTILRRWLR